MALPSIEEALEAADRSHISFVGQCLKVLAARLRRLEANGSAVRWVDVNNELPGIGKLVTVKTIDGIRECVSLNFDKEWVNLWGMKIDAQVLFWLSISIPPAP